MAEAKDAAVEQRVVALAEQLGRFIGTVQRKADGWLNNETLSGEVTRIRDEASALLEQIGASGAKGKSGAASVAAKNQPRAESQPASKARGRSGGVVDAPGKKHRSRPPSARGAKHSDDRVAKIVGAKTMRRGQRRG